MQLTEKIRELVGKIYSQREEILTAFVAKYGLQPEEAMQVEQRAEDGTSSWCVVRITAEEREKIIKTLMQESECSNAAS